MRCEGDEAHLETQNGVNGQVGKVVFVMRQNLGGERSAGNVDKILAEGDGIRAVGGVKRQVSASLRGQRGRGGAAERAPGLTPNLQLWRTRPLDAEVRKGKKSQARSFLPFLPLHTLSSASLTGRSLTSPLKAPGPSSLPTRCARERRIRLRPPRARFHIMRRSALTSLLQHLALLCTFPTPPPLRADHQERKTHPLSLALASSALRAAAVAILYPSTIVCG